MCDSCAVGGFIWTPVPLDAEGVLGAFDSVTIIQTAVLHD